jgi:hypothetical protein
MAYQTVNPYDNQIVATFDDLTDEAGDGPSRAGAADL